MAGTKISKRINSREKGKRGELELVHVFKSLYDLEARRGQQYTGGTDSPDVIVPSIPDVHWECKRVEKTALYAWVQQAVDDAGSRPACKLPVVVHKKNGKDWLVILTLDDFMGVLEKAGMIKYAD